MRTERTAEERFDAAIAALHAAETQIGRLRFKVSAYDEREREAASENVSFAIKEIGKARDGAES